MGGNASRTIARAGRENGSGIGYGSEETRIISFTGSRFANLTDSMAMRLAGEQSFLYCESCARVLW